MKSYSVSFLLFKKSDWYFCIYKKTRNNKTASITEILFVASFLIGFYSTFAIEFDFFAFFEKNRYNYFRNKQIS